MVTMSAIRSTGTSKWVTRPGNTTRARWLPCGSCCQLRKCGCGSTFISYPRMGVRACGAGRRRMVCGPGWTRRSYWYDVRWVRATCRGICGSGTGGVPPHVAPHKSDKQDERADWREAPDSYSEVAEDGTGTAMPRTGLACSG